MAMRKTMKRGAIALLFFVAFASISPLLASAGHESTNALVFAPVDASPSPRAAGEGKIEFHGGSEPKTRWTVTFTFTDLQPATMYMVVVRGRFGADESPEATAFTTLCRFRTDTAGAGGCWDYLVELRRVGVVQLRANGEDGAPVLQATREAGGPGSITSVPNRFSPRPPRR